MDSNQLHRLLSQVQSGKLPVAQAAQELADWPFSDLGIAKLDTQRAERCGLPEVIFAQGKTLPHLLNIAAHALKHAEQVLCTRVTVEQAKALTKKFPKSTHNRTARTCVLMKRKIVSKLNSKGSGVLIVAAGTSDLPVAEEAFETLRFAGISASVLSDVGVAGLHRLLAHLDEIRKADVIIAVAGMEGALASVIGGLVACPVIAVPTSTGYGAGAGGMAALYAMLNSCAAGVSVMNIDNGFGAAAAAIRILKKKKEAT